MSAYELVYAVVRQIPYGRVATYGQVATLANLPGQARLVGYALYRVTDDLEVPWHRVINAKGEISESPFRHGDDHFQRVLLEREGVQFSATGKINLKQYRWQPETVAVPELESAHLNESPDVQIDSSNLTAKHSKRQTDEPTNYSKSLR